MKHSTVDQLKTVATITQAPALSKRDVRRHRLLRLASLLDNHTGPLKLFHGLEFLRDSTRVSLRCENSPFSIAFSDPILRADGLESDEFGQGIQFFGLSNDEAHHLLCDCHFPSRTPSGQMIANRVRKVANRKTARERWQAVERTFAKFMNRWLPS